MTHKHLNYLFILLISCFSTRSTAQDNCTHGTLERNFAKTAAGVNHNRTLYTYNDQGDLICSESLAWDVLISIWKGTVKHVYTYDEQKNITSIQTYYWDTNLNKWKETNKVEQCFDTQGQLSQKTFHFWNNSLLNNSGDWDKNEKSIFTYDASGNEIICEVFTWNSETESWNPTHKYLSDYNNNNLITRQLYSWDETLNEGSGEWEENYQYKYSYDSFNNIILKEHYCWDSAKSTWDKTWGEKNEINYKNGPIETEKNSFYWDQSLNKGTGDWKKVSQIITESLGGKTSETYSKWETEKWIPNYKSVSDPDNKTLQENYRWNTALNNWQLSSGVKNEYTYDNNGHILSEKRFFWNKTLNNASGSWVHILSTTYNYNEKSTTGKEYSEKHNAICVWVEQKKLHITNVPVGETFILCSINGSIVHQEIANSNSLTVSLPGQGIYLLRLGSFSTKVLY